MIPGLAIFFVLLALLCVYRLIIGPTITDRLIAADTIGVFMSLVMLFIGLYYNIYLMVDIVLAYAVLFFVDILIFSKYFEHRELYK
ncbi:MAG TPA: monovalent cation/H+ antiporter complex subunit F [Halanaerobiales bacterium]|nr:monovalent cation/H+ antiporter complex subunit F [Halanaerobiales bacterium]